MKKLFIHHPLFRLLSPLFSGTLVYFLILLINNNIGQLQESFLGQELYVCIGLAYLIQEYARLSLLLFEKLQRPRSFFLRLLLQLTVSIVICIILVSVAMHLYFTNILGYSPNKRELLIFNSIFSFITLIYVMLYISHQFLYRVNTHRIAKEVEAKESVEADFIQFKKDINPDLLFETLESLLVLMKTDVEAAEQLSDNFSAVYRYILSRKRSELVTIEEEVSVMREQIELLNYLPFRNVQLGKTEAKNTLVVPGSMLVALERILRSTISAQHQRLTVDITEQDNHIMLQYQPEEKIRGSFSSETLRDIAGIYSYYSDMPVRVYKKESYKIVEFPKLELDESSDY